MCALAPSPDASLLAVLRDSGELQIWSGGAHHILLGATMTFGALAREAGNRRRKQAASGSSRTRGGGIPDAITAMRVVMLGMPTTIGQKRPPWHLLKTYIPDLTIFISIRLKESRRYVNHCYVTIAAITTE